MTNKNRIAESVNAILYEYSPGGGAKNAYGRTFQRRDNTSLPHMSNSVSKTSFSKGSTIMEYSECPAKRHPGDGVQEVSLIESQSSFS